MKLLILKKYLKLMSKSFINLDLKEIEYKSIDFNSKDIKDSLFNLEDIKNREPFYRNSFNYFNKLFFLLNEKQKKKIFLKKRKLKKNFILKILLHLRAGIIHLKRVRSKGIFFRKRVCGNYIRITKKFKQFQIMIISDKVGTEYFKNISKKKS